MGEKPAIVVVGSINMDLVSRAPRLPIPGETVLGGQFFRASGGKGANQAIAAARAALRPVAFLGAVGRDDFGRESAAVLEAEPNLVPFVKLVPRAATGVALILVDAQGQNMICVASGANLELGPKDVARLRSVFKAARVLLTNLESPLETVVRALVEAKQAGLITVLNPAPAQSSACQPDILKLVDVLTPNAGEARALADDPAGTIGAEQAARCLLDRGCAAVIVTLGKEGCLVVDATGATHIPGLPAAAIDATGAGDAFNGALAARLAEGHPLRAAAHWANAAAAVAVTRLGAQQSLPTRLEIEAAAAEGRGVRGDG